MTLIGMTNDVARGAFFGFAVLGGAAMANVTFSWLTGRSINSIVSGFGIGDGKGAL